MQVDWADGVTSFANKHVGSLAKLVAFRHVKMDLQLRGLGRVVKRDVPPPHQSPARCLCGQKELAQTEKAKVAEGGRRPVQLPVLVSARGPVLPHALEDCRGQGQAGRLLLATGSEDSADPCLNSV